MKKYHIGLDFGTYQSKACIYSLENDTHEFFRFENNSFFVPSKVYIASNDKLAYGFYNGEFNEEYSYFKIASAEDEQFHINTYNKQTPEFDNFKRWNDFKNFTPEFLSTVYLTYLLFVIKGKYRASVSSGITGGLLSKIIRRNENSENIEFTIQIGIPTEWSHQKNLLRKRKFENILLIAELLQKKYLNLLKYLEATSSQLKNDVAKIIESYASLNRDQFDKMLNDYGISVFPETAAGLVFITKTKQLSRGFYAIIDIGGGSTDISFFSITPTNNIKYLASESYLMASNNLYERFCANPESIESIAKAEKFVHRCLKEGNLPSKLRQDITIINNEIEKLVYRLFNNRVYYFSPNMRNHFCDQPIIYYGGGTKLFFKNGGLVIHDNGTNATTIQPTQMEKKQLQRFTHSINILPTDNTWFDDFSVLVVALGLSFIKPASMADWFDVTEYHTFDGQSLNLVPHPSNEDCYIYDVLISRWK